MANDSALYAALYPVSATEAIAHMRDWLCDCMWADVDEDEINQFPDGVIIRAVERHYDGGKLAFMRTEPPNIDPSGH